MSLFTPFIKEADKIVGDSLKFFKVDRPEPPKEKEKKGRKKR